MSRRTRPASDERSPHRIDPLVALAERDLAHLSPELRRRIAAMALAMSEREAAEGCCTDRDLETAGFTPLEIRMFGPSAGCLLSVQWGALPEAALVPFGLSDASPRPVFGRDTIRGGA